MDIKIKKSYGKDKIENLITYVKNMLDGRDYGMGRIEATTTTADNCSDTIARLCNVLATNDIISPEDVIFVATGKRND